MQLSDKALRFCNGKSALFVYFGIATVLSDGMFFGHFVLHRLNDGVHNAQSSRNLVVSTKKMVCTRLNQAVT
jgi:hypothetical protein